MYPRKRKYRYIKSDNNIIEGNNKRNKYNLEEDDWGINSNMNHIYFTGDITLRSMSKLYNTLLKINNEYSELTRMLTNNENQGYIYLHIQSGGGDVYSSLKVVDLITNMNNSKRYMNVNTVIEGEAASAATIISIAGKIRYMTKNSYMLIHQGSTWINGWINKWEFDDENKNFTKLENDVNKLYYKYCNLKTSEKKKKLRDILSHDLYFNFKKSKEYGLVDKYYINTGEFYK